MNNTNHYATLPTKPWCVAEKAANLADTSVDVEHQDDSDEIDNGKYVLS